MNTALLHAIPMAAAAPRLLKRLVARSGESSSLAPETGAGLATPADSGSAAAPASPEAAFAAAAELLQQGQARAAQDLLRQIPQHGGCRSEAVALSVAAAAQDPEFLHLTTLADEARDRQLWAEAEFFYWRALALYPLHAGYGVQYGHALKEQGKFPDAEIAYRSALALGETAVDLGQHIAHVAGMLGHAVAPPLVHSAVPAPVLPLDEAPCRDDIELAFALLLHRRPRMADEVLALMREAPTRRAVLLNLLGREEMVSANRELMLLLAQAG